MLQQMFKITSTRFRSAMQTLVPLIDSVVDRLSQKRMKASSAIRQRALGAHQLK